MSDELFDDIIDEGGFEIMESNSNNNSKRKIKWRQIEDTKERIRLKKELESFEVNDYDV